LWLEYLLQENVLKSKKRPELRLAVPVFGMLLFSPGKNLFTGKI